MHVSNLGLSIRQVCHNKGLSEATYTGLTVNSVSPAKYRGQQAQNYSEN